MKLQFDVLTKLVCNCVKRMKQDTPPRRVRCADDDVATRVFVSLHTESCLVTRKIVVIWTLPAFRCITLQRRLQQQQETLELQKRKKLHHWRLLSQLKIDHIVFGTQATTFSAEGCEDFFYANFLFLPEVTVVLVGSDQGSSINNHIREI